MVKSIGLWDWSLERIFDFGPCGTGAKTCYDCPHFFENCFPSREVAERGRNATRSSALSKPSFAQEQAWARVKPENWIMKVVGPDSYGHKADVLAKLDALGIEHFDCPPPPSTSTSSFWLFCDTMNDTEKWAAYRSADLLVHPSVSENFGITIVEGLYAGLPAIATKGTPWKDLVDYKCGWWIDQGVDALAATLREATSTSDLHLLGQRGHALIQEKYTWPAIAQTVMKGYEAILKHAT